MRTKEHLQNKIYAIVKTQQKSLLTTFNLKEKFPKDIFKGISRNNIIPKKQTVL